MEISKSTALRLARELLGPNAWVKPGPDGLGYVVYVQEGSTRTYYGAGATLLAAINDCFVLEQEMRAEANERFSILNSPEIDSKISSTPESDSDGTPT